LFFNRTPLLLLWAASAATTASASPFHIIFVEEQKKNWVGSPAIGLAGAEDTDGHQGWSATL